MSGNLTEEQVKEFSGVFYYFGADGEGSIKKSDVAHVMRALGQNPSESEMR